MRFLVAFAVSCVCFSGFAQKQASIWYFGEFAGLNLCNELPLALFDGRLNSLGASEGTASISNDLCNLQLYSDGVSIYNRYHDIIHNGTNLWGHYSTTQTLIVPQPGNDSIFYIFTMSPQYNAIFASSDSVGCHYSVVNLAHNNGLGAVTEKNKLLFKKTTEKVAAVHHANGNDIWVVFHEWESNCFRSYLITETGINVTPTISCLGSIHQGGSPSPSSNSNAIGQMKISPDGRLLALALLASRKIEVFFLMTRQAW